MFIVAAWTLGSVYRGSTPRGRTVVMFSGATWYRTPLQAVVCGITVKEARWICSKSSCLGYMRFLQWKICHLMFLVAGKYCPKFSWNFRKSWDMPQLCTLEAVPFKQKQFCIYVLRKFLKKLCSRIPVSYTCEPKQKLVAQVGPQLWPFGKKSLS